MSASTEKKLRREARDAGIDKKAAAAREAAEKTKKNNRRWTLVGAGVALLVAVALLLNSGFTYKMTAYTVGDRDFSAAEVNYQFASQYSNFVNQYGSYAAIFGLDTSTGIHGLEDQPCSMSEDGGSWRDYFMDAAKTSMLQTKALSDYAAANSISLTEEEIAEVSAMYEGMDDVARSYGYSNADQFFAANYGAGVDLALVLESTEEAALCGKVVDQVTNSFTYTEAELEQQYQSYEGSRDIYSYAYYFIAAEASEDGSYSEDAIANAMAEAEQVVLAYNDEKAEDFVEKFEAAVKLYNSEAEINESSSAASSVPAASEWIAEDGRKAGDITVAESSNGAYIVLYLDYSDNHYNMAQVRHILVKAEADENGEYTDEAKKAAKARAEEILDEFNAGDKSEESFAALALQYSEDAGSSAEGGLYENVTKGQMVEEFDAFCFDEHKKGDTAIVYGESASYAGYHVMYYVGEGQLYSSYLAENDLRSADVSQWLEELVGSYETSDGKGMRYVA